LKENKMKNSLFILAIVIGLSSIAFGQWTNPPSRPDGTPGVTPSTITELMRITVKKPTNTWQSGYVITTYDAGTTTVAVANDASGLPVETAARVAADASLSNAVTALQNAGYATNDQWAADVAAATANMATNSQWAADVAAATLNMATGGQWAADIQTVSNQLFAQIGAAGIDTNAVNAMAITNVAQAVYDTARFGLATGTPLYVEAGTGTLVAASIAAFMPGAAISNEFYPASNPSNYIKDASGWSGFAATSTVSVGTNYIVGGNHAGPLAISGASDGLLVMGLFNGKTEIFAARGIVLRGASTTNAHLIANTGAVGSVFSGRFLATGANYQTNEIGKDAMGSFTRGSYNVANTRILGVAADQAINAASSTAVISGDGGVQRGRMLSAIATNDGIGAVQLFNLESTEQAITAAGADGSILLGPGIITNKYGIKTATGGNIEAGGIFIGSAAGLTNFPATLATEAELVSSSNTLFAQTLAIGAGATSLTLQAWATGSNALIAANGVGLVATNLHLQQGVIASQAVNGVVAVGLVATNAAAGVVAVGAVASNAYPIAGFATGVAAEVNSTTTTNIPNWSTIGASQSVAYNSNNLVDVRYIIPNSLPFAFAETNAPMFALWQSGSDWYYRRTSRSTAMIYSSGNISPVTITAATNLYWQQTTTEPTSSSDLGSRGQMSITPRDATSVWINIFHLASNKWYRAAFSEFAP
jgi:hypothetical protein